MRYPKLAKTISFTPPARGFSFDADEMFLDLVAKVSWL